MVAEQIRAETRDRGFLYVRETRFREVVVLIADSPVAAGYHAHNIERRIAEYCAVRGTVLD